LIGFSVYLSARTPPTSDEFTFVASGYSYWKTADFRMNTEQPPLIKLFNTIPLLFMGLNLPLEHSSWVKAKLFEMDGFYKYFIFHINNDKKEMMLFWSRISNIFFSVLLAILVLKWSTGLFGNWAGTTALGLFSLNPNIIAYTSVFMMDIGFAAFSTLAFYSLWKYFIKPSRKNLAVSAVAFSMMPHLFPER